MESRDSSTLEALLSRHEAVRARMSSSNCSVPVLHPPPAICMSQTSIMELTRVGTSGEQYLDVPNALPAPADCSCPSPAEPPQRSARLPRPPCFVSLRPCIGERPEPC